MPMNLVRGLVSNALVSSTVPMRPFRGSRAKGPSGSASALCPQNARAPAHRKVGQSWPFSGLVRDDARWDHPRVAMRIDRLDCG